MASFIGFQRQCSEGLPCDDNANVMIDILVYSISNIIVDAKDDTMPYGMVAVAALQVYNICEEIEASYWRSYGKEFKFVLYLF